MLLTLLAWYLPGSVMVWRPSVCSTVCPTYRPLQQHVAGLLLWAQPAGDRSIAAATGRPAAQHSAANASSITLSADIRS